MWLHVPDEPPEVGDDDLKVLSLCSGAAMLDVGLAEGWRELTAGRQRAVTVGYCERQAGAAATLVARMEDSGLDRAPIWDDLESFPCEAYRGRVDCVSAGIPCQPWSAAGAKLGLRDPRWLWPQVLRILRETGARILWLENVRGFLAPGAAGETGWVYPSGLDLVLRDLADMGWAAEWGCLPASALGARHQRYRTFVLAVSDGNDSLRPRRARPARPLRPGRDAAHDAGRVRPDAQGKRKREPHAEETAKPAAEARRVPGGLGHDGPDAERHGRPQGTEALRQGQPVTPARGGARPDSEGGEGQLLLQQGEPGQAGHDAGGRGRDWPFFARAPQDPAAWEAGPLLAPAVEPGLRVGLHGLALVVDEARNLQLRTSGNGVVAVQAAIAAVVLGRRLGLNGGSK